MEVGRSTTVHIFCFSLMHKLRNGDVLLVSLMNTRTAPIVFCQVLCTETPKIVACEQASRLGKTKRGWSRREKPRSLFTSYQNSGQKPRTKNFAGFHNHFTLLTMLRKTFSRKTLSPTVSPQSLHNITSQIEISSDKFNKQRVDERLFRVAPLQCFPHSPEPYFCQIVSKRF